MEMEEQPLPCVFLPYLQPGSSPLPSPRHPFTGGTFTTRPRDGSPGHQVAQPRRLTGPDCSPGLLPPSRAFPATAVTLPGSPPSC